MSKSVAFAALLFASFLGGDASADLKKQYESENVPGPKLFYRRPYFWDDHRGAYMVKPSGDVRQMIASPIHGVRLHGDKKCQN